MRTHYQFTHRRTVEFAETDMAGIVHFANFFRWMEAAEAAFFRSLDEPLIVAEEDKVAGWPRVRASCAYHAPLQFEDEVEVRLMVRELKIRAIAYAFRFYKAGQPEKVASGELTTVFAQRLAQGGPMQSASIPKSLLAKLAEAPSDVICGD